MNFALNIFCGEVLVKKMFEFSIFVTVQGPIWLHPRMF